MISHLVPLLRNCIHSSPENRVVLFLSWVPLESENLGADTGSFSFSSLPPFSKNTARMDSLFFALSKILLLLVFPLPLFFCLAFLWAWKGKTKSFLVLLVSFLVLASEAYVAIPLVRLQESDFPPVDPKSLPKKDVAIVLGGMVQTLTRHPGRVELTDAADRLFAALSLYRLGKVQKILFTGGSGFLFAQESKEAEQALLFFTMMGVPKEDLVLESQSRNTYENAAFSRAIWEKENWVSGYLVTSAFHMRRSLACFQKQNIPVTPFATDYRDLDLSKLSWEVLLPSTSFLELTTLVWKEWLGIWAYRFRGYL